MKNSLSTITIIKRILNLKVSLTVSKLLTSALIVEKQLIIAIIEDITMKFWVNTLKSNTFELQNSY